MPFMLPASINGSLVMMPAKINKSARFAYNPPTLQESTKIIIMRWFLTLLLACKASRWLTTLLTLAPSSHPQFKINFMTIVQITREYVLLSGLLQPFYSKVPLSTLFLETVMISSILTDTLHSASDMKPRDKQLSESMPKELSVSASLSREPFLWVFLGVDYFSLVGYGEAVLGLVYTTQAFPGTV